MLCLILGARASSKRRLPTSVVVAGGFAAAVTWALNHRVLKSPSVAWTSLFILLLLFILFWGRGNPDEDKVSATFAKEDSSSILHIVDKRD